MQPHLYWSRVLAAALRSPTAMPAVPHTDRRSTRCTDCGSIRRRCDCERSPLDARTAPLRVGAGAPSPSPTDDAMPDAATPDTETMEHATTPWEVSTVEVDGYPCHDIGSTPDDEVVCVDVETLQDARRIVACVNFCEGTPTDLLEAGIEDGQSLETVRANEQAQTQKASERGVPGLTAAGGEVDELRKRVEQMESLLRNSCSALITQALMLKDRDPDDNAERIAYAKQSRCVREILRALDYDEDSHAALATEDTEAA